MLIRGAEADDVAGTDEQALKVDCNMAQAFEIPKGVTGQRIPAYPRVGSAVSRRQVPGNAFFQIAAPDPTRGRIGTWNMGPPPDRRKRVDTALARSSASPIPGSAIRFKVNRFCRI
ncbi:hypothetical protein [Bradyrhizobium sp. CB3481]|uniref:hypothetical protein n=1 Tax=Bradyrhizobium sp. CB3481 TaxID=3039158 RepID=UPI0024B22920|nr:hypothetical protein [Bradyrhizobium sp. CB3481]WFU20011.1 hypothetical protein QA643_17620 [Bradyrhizobium sp. CB3481]